MKNACYLLLIGTALFLLAGVVFGQAECKSYCDDAVKAVQELDETICAKASEIGRASMILASQGVEGAEEIGQKLNETYPEYMDAKKLVGIGMYIYDLTGAFEEAGVQVEGFNYENAARIVTAGKSKLDALETKLDSLADELDALTEPDKAA